MPYVPRHVESCPALQDYLPGKTILTELIDSDDRLTSGLKNRLYDLIILHAMPNDRSLYCQRYMDEQIYISIDSNHPIAAKESVSFKELKGIRILLTANIGFWMRMIYRLSHGKRKRTPGLFAEGPFSLKIQDVESSQYQYCHSDPL